MENDFFWWLDSIARSLDIEDQSRLSWARQVTGASRRQERLQAQREITQEIGEEHEISADCYPGTGSQSEMEKHEHAPSYSEDGGRCDWTDAFGHVCQANPTVTCTDCGGNGLGVAEKNEYCKTCGGRGKLVDPDVDGNPTPGHSHPAPYVDQSDIIHDFGDGWTIRKTKTYGDLAYEGKMMNHCVQDDAEPSNCETCDGSGRCNECEDGRVECAGCEGVGGFACEDCNGSGERTCEECEDSSSMVPDPGCNGTGKEEVCKGCNYGKESHDILKDKRGDLLRDEDWTPHDYEPKEVEHSVCRGSGKRMEWTPGVVDCEECDGYGKLDMDDDDDEECWSCDGTGKKDCPNDCNMGQLNCGTCEGTGSFDCEYCDGSGSDDHYDCDGTGICQDCEGKVNESGGAANYYKPYTQKEAEDFSRAPGGAYSLRDPDNIPHVTFLHGTTDDDFSNANNIFGREDTPPKPEYARRILQYMQTNVPAGPCSTCKGTKRQQFHNHGEVRERQCIACDGTGESMVSIGWGNRSGASYYTAQQLSDAISGNVPKPDVMLLAQHQQQPNKVKTLTDVKDAVDESGRIDYRKVNHEVCSGTGTLPYTPCPRWDHKNDGECDGSGKLPGESTCTGCGGNGTARQHVEVKDVYNLHAIKTEDIGDEKLEYDPYKEAWKLKDGKGTKVPFSSDTKVPWEAAVKSYRLRTLFPPNSAVDIGESRDKHAPLHDSYEELKQVVPEHAKKLFLPRVAKKIDPLAGWKAPSSICWRHRNGR